MHTLSSTEFCKAAYHTAHHFGFHSLDELAEERGRRTRKSNMRASMTDRKLDALGGMLTAGLSRYLNDNLYTEKPELFFSLEALPRTGELALNLQVVGVKKSIAEALLIQSIRSLLTDLGYAQTLVRINSLGDSDSVVRYTRELTTYLRKRLEDMPPQAREIMKENAIAALLHLLAQDHELCTRTPSPLEYLSEASRRHFREIIEYLDMSATPYEIDGRLIGHHHCYSDALFAIDLLDEDAQPQQDAPFTIRGGRLDAFVKRSYRREVPASGAVVVFKSKKAPARMPKPARNSVPSVFVVQLGFGPKVKSLMLLDTLKAAHIPVRQSVVSDSLSEQLRQAESAGVPFSIILGQKEFVENSVIVRDMRSCSQESVPFDALVTHLKRITKQA